MDRPALSAPARRQRVHQLRLRFNRLVEDAHAGRADWGEVEKARRALRAAEDADTLNEPK